jgi:putative peptidoglycan lipid II flippase
MSIVEINFMIDMRFSSFLPAGSLSLIRYAFRFIGIPLGVMATSFATVLLPHFSRIGAENKKDLSFNLFEAIKFIVWIIVPIIFLMGLFSAEIFETLYSNGPEMVEKIKTTQTIFLVFLAGLLSFSLNRILLNVFYALEMPRTPFFVSVLSVFVNFFMNKTLIQFYGAPGIAAASVFAAVMQTTIYLLYLYIKLGLEFDLRKFVKFLVNCVKQWLVIFSVFFVVIQQLGAFVASLNIDISLLSFNWKTDFFLHSFGLWAWVGPVAAIFLLSLYRTRKRFGVNLYFLDK